MEKHFILFSVLLLSLLVLSVSGQVFWRVNCGESEPYTDDNLMSWDPDVTLISTGVARVVQSNSISTVLDSLRVFNNSRKKNCYSTPVTKDEQVLVRASFNYGNYDGLSRPPTFDLHFDGNFWTTVETSNSGLNVYEATYVTKGDTVSVCVAQTKSGQFPFMSALEVGSVDSKVYGEFDANRAIFLINRFSYGASEIVRSPQDSYDRIWIPAIGGTENVTNDATIIDPTGANNPPSEIFANAVTVKNISDSLYLFTVFPSNTPLYMITYFSEVSDLESTGQTRSFRFYETTSTESRSISSEPISPPYGTMSVIYMYNYTVDSITNISLIATTSSDLPPIINAIEMFNISEVLTDGTDSNDVAILTSIQNTFTVLGEWSGDPCLPAPYSWDWLNCSDEKPPRITSLFLDGFNLSGELPDISSMDAIEIIDLHNNNLDGEIPSFLGTMTNLQQLNLADNDFSGLIPTSLSKNNNLKLTVSGNPSLCTSGKPCSSSPGTVDSSPGTLSSSPGSTTTSRSKKKKKSSLPVVLGTTIPSFFLVWIVAGVFTILRKKMKRAKDKAATGHTTTSGSNGNINSGGEANKNSDWLNKIGKEMKEVVNNVAPTTFGSPSPFLDEFGKNSEAYEAEVKTNDQR